MQRNDIAPAGDRRLTLLGAPAGAIYVLLFLAPLLMLAHQSFLLFEPGYVGARPGAPATLENYRELFDGAFLGSLLITFKIGLVASLAGVCLAYPLAYLCVRSSYRPLAIGLLLLFIVMMFLGVLIRTYALELMFGSLGPLHPLMEWAGIVPTSRGYIEVAVGLGLLHYIIPLSALTLIPSIQAINPSLHESAISLGASRVMAHATITLPLSAGGAVTAFMLSMTFSISAFVIPMILGRGRVTFVSSLIYNRFSEIANYPSGAAVSIATLILSLLFIYALTVCLSRWSRTRLHS